MSSDSAPPASEHPFAPYIRILGKGKSGTRSLSRKEAHEAFGMLLRGQAEPMQVGAFLMLLRVKEETAEELAGFVEACRDSMLLPGKGLTAHLDWSSYAGKRNQHPWYILSMLILAEAGYRVFVHGSGGHTPGRLYTEQAMRQLGLPVASDWGEVAAQLSHDHLSYLALEHFCQPLHELIQLRSLLGLRSPVNTLCRLINPLRAECSVQSIFHPAYAVLHQEADRLLEQPRALVFKGESGEVEVKPQADTRLCLLEERQLNELTLPRSLGHRIEGVGDPCVQPLRALWMGDSKDEYGLLATLSTAAVALIALSPGLAQDTAQSLARDLWENRNLEKLS